MGFWDSLFTGQNKTLDTAVGTTGQVAGFGTGRGEKNLSTASDWWNSIISGDATKQMQAVAPEASAAKKSAQQDTKTATELGTRSGGTAASNAATTDKIHEYMTNLLGSLTGSAVSGLATTGSNLLNTGLEATGMQSKLSEQQMQDWNNSLFGLAVTKGGGFAEGAGLNWLAGKFGLGGNTSTDTDTDTPT
jgi:hypothetical protein